MKMTELLSLKVYPSTLSGRNIYILRLCTMMCNFCLNLADRDSQIFFFAKFTKGNRLCKFLFASLHNNLKGKSLLPEEKLFSLETDLQHDIHVKRE